MGEDSDGTTCPSSSSSFFFCRSSISVTCWSVIFCTSSRPRRSSSSEILWSLSSFFSRSFASRRTWRTALRPSSAYLCTSRDSSLRRSSVSAGIGIRMTLPSLTPGSAEVGSSESPCSMAPMQRRIERLRDDQRRLGHRERRHLIERHHACRRPRRARGRAATTDARPRAHAGQLLAHVLDRAVHPLLDFGVQALRGR